MPKITINGKEIEFEQGMTILQACEIAGAEIPRFCYHERLSIAGVKGIYSDTPGKENCIGILDFLEENN
mgnify:CR=1 FL=1